MPGAYGAPPHSQPKNTFIRRAPRRGPVVDPGFGGGFSGNLGVFSDFDGPERAFFRRIPRILFLTYPCTSEFILGGFGRFQNKCPGRMCGGVRNIFPCLSVKPYDIGGPLGLAIP